MKKTVFVIALLASFATAKAQSYLGYYHDNYAGVQGVLFNPASIVDSRFKTDINLLSFSTSVSNDMYGVNFSDVMKSGYDFDTQAQKSFTNANKVNMNMDVMGPSFMFNIAPKHSLAIFTRARAIGNLIDINGNVINEISKDNKNNFNYNLGSPNAVGNSWGEIGISYAAVLYQKGEHFLKGGITAKYLQGIANYHFQGTNVTMQYNENVPIQNSNYTTTGTAVYGSSQDFSNNSNVSIDSKSNGFGADLGLVYEWRPDFDASRKDINDLKYLNKYKIRFGFALTDLGSMMYDKGVRNSYNLNQTITQNDIDNADNFDQLMKNKYSSTAINGAVKSKLPTAIHTDVDWNIHNKFYVNLNGDISVVSKTVLNQNSIANRVSLTPRYESRWFSFYVPISYMDVNKQTQVGVGLRTGVLFIGSGSIVSNVISNNSRAADFYFGVKIPVYQKKAKDQDGDGILDKNDECPEISGPVENKGCPWKDADGDSVLDKDDKCPTVAGPVENSGCPWADTDRDSVLDKDDKCPTVAGPVENSGCPWADTDGDKVLDKDDKCPTVAGPVENSGCPWADTDGDTVLDKDDKCPTVKGTVANNGCQEITAAVIKKLNQFSKSVLFDSSKATIKLESNSNLESIVKVMNEYNSANFRLEGHTDNTGNAAKNLQLSKERAAAIKTYLIANGIKENRLSSEGYGIEKPIVSNKTAAGKAQNRRVEIILVQ
jgi:outer membrane protein OmpA-like peptidoglycan-associated protein